MYLTFLKPVLKLVLPYLVKYLILKAEEEIKEAKSGAGKKAKVIAEVEDFAEKAGFSGLLKKEKLEKLIDNQVQTFINKR